MLGKKLILLLLLGIIFVSGCVQLQDKQSKFGCTKNEDCVPAQCCHPRSCINKNHAPDCSGIFCTEECRSGTMDCGQGRCVCEAGECRVEWTKQKSSSLANPSAVYCEDLGYKYEIKTLPSGGQYGVCIFPDNSSCDGWDFFRGKCGQKFSYCEKNGGEIKTVKQGGTFSSEHAVCILPDEKECSEWKYFRGGCR